MVARQDGPKIHGVLWVDKPAGPTSQQVVHRLKRHFGWLKAGHTGTLDPGATGLLMVCVNEATKFASYNLAETKRYIVQGRWGWSSDTLDADGDVVPGRRPPSLPDATAMQARIDTSFRGELEQLPPMVSAIKQGGVPLHRLARAGQVVERQPRRITLHSVRVLACDTSTFTLDVVCSKGTYMRSLVVDVAASWGADALVHRLQRVAIGPCDVGEACPLPTLLALPPDEPMVQGWHPTSSLVAWMPQCTLPRELAARFVLGQRVASATVEAGTTVSVWSEGAWLGLGLSEPEGVLKPKRLMQRSVP